jgi:hypothetical protein
LELDLFRSAAADEDEEGTRCDVDEIGGAGTEPLVRPTRELRAEQQASPDLLALSPARPFRAELERTEAKGLLEGGAKDSARVGITVRESFLLEGAGTNEAAEFPPA